MSATSPGWSTNEDKAIGFHDLQYHHRGVGGGCIRLPRPTLLPLHSHFHFITAHQQQLKARPGPPSSPSTTDVSIQHQQENINHQGKPTKDLTDANKLSQSALSSLLPTQSTLFLSSPFFTAQTLSARPSTSRRHKRKPAGRIRLAINSQQMKTKQKVEAGSWNGRHTCECTFQRSAATYRNHSLGICQNHPRLICVGQ